MRRIVLISVVVAVALGAWFAFSDRGARVVGPEGAPDDAGPVGPGVRPPISDSAPLKSAPEPTRRVLPHVPTSVDYKTGSLAVRLITGTDTPVPPSTRVDVDSLGHGLVAQPLPDRDESGVFHFVKIPVGPYRVRVMAEGFQDATVDAVVTEDAEATVDVPLHVGATASYAVALPDGTAPESVTIALLDPRERTLAYTVQTTATTLHTSPGKPVALPAKGRLIGLRPGKYVLRATSPSGESVDRPFDAKAGDEAVIEMTIRK